MIEWLTQAEFLDNPIRLWLFAAVSGLIGYLLVHSGLRFAAARLRERQARAPIPARAVILALLKATRQWLILPLAVVLAADAMSFTPRVAALLAHASFAFAGLQMALWASGLIHLWLRNVPSEPGRRAINPVLAGMLSWVAQFVIWTVLLLFFLANVGVNVTAFVASLGIGGIAVALALQNVLGDLFASAAIGLDKPFEVGQVIAFGDELGTVTHVGMKTTRIRSLSGEELVISNTHLLKELIHNHSRRTERRIVFGFRVPYGTPRAHIQAIPGRVRRVIELEEQVRFDRGHFAALGEHGPEFEFVYFVLAADYTLYRDIQQRINLGIMELLEEMGAEFAVPARQVSLVAGAAGAAGGGAVLAPPAISPMPATPGALSPPAPLPTSGSS